MPMPISATTARARSNQLGPSEVKVFIKEAP